VIGVADTRTVFVRCLVKILTRLPKFLAGTVWFCCVYPGTLWDIAIRQFPSKSLLAIRIALFHFIHVIYKLYSSQSIITYEGVDKNVHTDGEDCFVQNGSEQTSRPDYCTLCRFEFTSKYSVYYSLHYKYYLIMECLSSFCFQKQYLFFFYHHS